MVRVPVPDSMDHTEIDMMESEIATKQQAELPSNSGEGDPYVLQLLAFARQLVDQGKPSQALQAVVAAMKSRGGDEAVFRSLHRAKELYRSRLQNNADVDQLASLFAECAIAELQPVRCQTLPNNTADPSVIPDVHGNSILAETGRMQIVMEAFADGSSFICLRCGGLVSNSRKDEHYAYWCC